MTDFVVTITGGHPVPKTTTGHHESFEHALEEAHTFAMRPHNALSVVTVWARQGRNVWPVRILYPKVRPVSQQDYGIPYADPEVVYMVDTQHPLSAIYMNRDAPK